MITDVWPQLLQIMDYVEKARMHKLLAKLHFEGKLPQQEEQELDDLIVLRLQCLGLKKRKHESNKSKQQ